MNGWKKDKKWSDKFIPEIKQILGWCLIDEPPEVEDQQRNTDLVVLRMAEIRVACRVRKNKYYKTYKNQFTIRSGRPNGVKTEITKIIEGWGRYLFYGFCGPEETSLIDWRLIDLNQFRLWFNRELFSHNGKRPGIAKPNADGSSSFLVFDVTKMPGDIIYKTSAQMFSETEALTPPV